MKEQDRELEAILARELNSLPPDDEVVEQTNPWEEPVTRIALGLALTTIKLHMLWLEYILPTVGVILLFLGFRTLRRENKWFFLGWLFTVYRLADWLAGLMIAALPGSGEGLPTTLTAALATVIQAGFFLVLRKALDEVFQKAEAKREDAPLLLLAVLSVVMVALALSPLSHSWLAAIPTLGFYIYAVRALYHLPEKLSDAGYALTAAPVRLSDNAVRLAYFLLCLVIVIGGSLFAAHIPLEAVPDREARSASVRQELLELGFPEEQLRDLPDNHLEGLSGAVYVDVSQELLMFDPHDEPEENSYGLVYQYVQAPGKVNLDVTAATVELPGHHFRTFVFFRWKSMTYGSDHGPFWSDGFSFTPEEYAEVLTYDGALIYERKGETWTAPIPELTMGERTSTGFFGTSTYQAITGRVNYPFGAEGRRGWLMVDFDLPEDNWLGAMILNWYRTGSPRFPYTDPVNSNDFTFRNRRQFYTTFQTLSRHEWEQAGEPEEWPPQQ